jgi:hypothetical protein
MSVVTVDSDISSSSQGRPRAIEATSLARKSAPSKGSSRHPKWSSVQPNSTAFACRRHSVGLKSQGPEEGLVLAVYEVPDDISCYSGTRVLKNKLATKRELRCRRSLISTFISDQVLCRLCGVYGDVD